VDEREGEVVAADRGRAFNRQGVWKRSAIVAAGPLANLLLAVLLLAGTYVAGVPGQRAVLSAPPIGSAAAAAGLVQGDVITALDGSPVRSWQDLRWRVLHASGSDAVQVTVERADGVHSERSLSLAAVRPDDWEGNFLSVLGLKLDLGAPVVRDVVAGKPADASGLRAGDAILAVNGEPMRSPADVAAATNAHPGERVRFSIRRDARNLDVEITPEST